MSRKPNYDKFPTIEIPDGAGHAWRGWEAIGQQLRAAITSPNFVIAIECYSSLDEALVQERLTEELHPDYVFESRSVLLPSEQIDRRIAPFLGGDDPVFGRLCPLELNTFFDEKRRHELCAEIHRTPGILLVFGIGATLICDPDLLIYADMPRWEAQLRQRRGSVSNLGAQNAGDRPGNLYKRSFFVDWRVLDRTKERTLPHWDYTLDTTNTEAPVLVEGQAMRDALAYAATNPFRLKPFFDPGPWGGQWMKEVCGLDPSAPNFAWCFDGVPEENSVLLRFGDVVTEVPAQNILAWQPKALLGEAVYGVFGPEFPIRFDFLDTMGGGNLSLQVHPDRTYAHKHFGLFYTQDESYYILDAKPGAHVYLGLREGIDPPEMLHALRLAQSGGAPFEADRFAQSFPARAHDHFLIPAGTVHCSGAETMVLEISATPYIFTFKLWDWDRLGLDGRPRPIHLDRGAEVIDWTRTASWAARELISHPNPVASGPGWREERTGLHELEFIEMRRHWFTGPVAHDTAGTVNVLNLVQGEEAIVESPAGKFPPFVVHYAETFVIPASVGEYTIRPSGIAAGTECATMKAFVRADIRTRLQPLVEAE